MKNIKKYLNLPKYKEIFEFILADKLAYMGKTNVCDILEIKKRETRCFLFEKLQRFYGF